MDTDYNVVSTALESGVLKMSGENFTQTRNEKEFEDHVTMVKDKSDRDFYVFMENLE